MTTIQEGSNTANPQGCEKEECWRSSRGNQRPWLPRSLECRGRPLFGWLARYRQGGDALGRSETWGAARPNSTGKMPEWVYDTVATKDPRQMQFPFALWTSLHGDGTERRQFGIQLSGIDSPQASPIHEAETRGTLRRTYCLPAAFYLKVMIGVEE